MKNILIIASLIIFNDFIGSILMSLGLLVARLGACLQSIPEIF